MEGYWPIILTACAAMALCLYSCSGSKQSNYQHMVIDINGHYVYFSDSANETTAYSDAKHVQLNGIGGISSNSIVLYESEPDRRCYEYTAAEFAEHVCSPDADWRCPHSEHEVIK